MDDRDTAMVPETPDRVQLLKDVAVFQAKLILDGLMDFILLPVSAVAAFVSFFERGEHRDLFYRVVATGSRVDRWINLFGVGERYAGRSPATGEGGSGFDEVVERIEGHLRREYDEGRLPRPARETIDRVLRRLRDEGRKEERSDDEANP